MVGYIIAILLLVVAVVAVVTLWLREGNVHTKRIAELNEELNTERISRTRAESERDALRSVVEQSQSG